MIRLWLITAAAVVSLMAATACTDPQTQEPEVPYTPNDVPIAVTWYSGYGHGPAYPFPPSPGVLKTNWNDSRRVFFIEPEIGWYSTGNESTIAWQLAEMKKAGISVLMISWWGWGDGNLDGVDDRDFGVAHNNDTIVLLDYIKNNNLDFKFAVLVEDFWGVFSEVSTGDLTHAQKQMIADYVYNNFYHPSKYGDFAYEFKGRPLLVSTIGDGHDRTGPLWREFNDERFTLKELYWNEKDEDTQWTALHYKMPPSPLPGPDGVAMIWPRKDELYLWVRGILPEEHQPSRIDPMLSEGAYDKAWKDIIEHSPRDDLKLVWIWSWNSYEDLISIEPDKGRAPQAQGDLLVRKTAHYANLFRKGLPFQHFDEPDEL